MSIEPQILFTWQRHNILLISLSELLPIKKIASRKVFKYVVSWVAANQSEIYEKLTYLSLMRLNAVTWSHLLHTKN